MKELMNIYFKSIGRGQPFLLNIPPTPEGVIAQKCVDRVQEFGQTIHNSFRENLVFNHDVIANASSQRGENYRAENVLNNNTGFYWVMNENDQESWPIVEFHGLVMFDVIAICE
jgi:alpha-L-fucosidase